MKQAAADGAATEIGREVIAGVTTFLTMAYVVVVNPAILATPGTGLPFAGVLTATVLVAFSMTLLMGLYAKLPFGVAPGMGLNAFFTFSLVLGRQIPWQHALGIVFWAGVLFLLLSVTKARTTLAKAIPQGLRGAAAVGIGLFLTLIGLKNAGLVVADPVTFVKLGVLDAKAILSLLGLIVMAWLTGRGSALAFLIGMAVVTALGAAMGMVTLPSRLVSMPDFSSVMLKLDAVGALKLAYLPAIVAVCLTDLFDSLSTFMGVAKAANLVDATGEPKNLHRGLTVDALATLGAGLLGTSPGTAYIESLAGIEAGGRTGLTAVVTALCFLPCLFLGPLAAIIPPYATAPVLIVVGAMMFKTAGVLSFDRIEDALPQYLVIALIPLTFSITQGLLFGFLAHVLLYVLRGRRREVQPGMWLIAAASLALLVIDQF